ncbi:MAG: response regulator transcription factor [Anaerolineales bacterium]|nr:response regulator transcription factor [Anaerolineales bacterium]
MLPESNTAQRSEDIRVLLANNCPLILAGIRAIVLTNTDVIIMGEVADGTEAQRLSQELVPDVLLLDLEMPGPSPLEIVTHLRQQCPAIKIMALTDGNDEAAIREVVAAGVAGCLLETEPPEIVVQALRSVAQGGVWFSQAVMEILAHPPAQAQLPHLTEDELAVLGLVVVGKTDRQIGWELGLSERTVRYRLQNIYDKLGVSTRIEAAVKAVRLGLA